MKAFSKEAEGGYLYDMNGVKILDLHGSWKEMGRQYGILAQDLVKDVYGYVIRKTAGDPARMDAVCDIADKLYSNYPAHLNDFFHGAEETSGMDMQKLKIANAVEYAEGCFQCSAMAVWGEYSSGPLVFGRNYDAASYKELASDIVVTVYHPEGKMAAATIGYAGEIYCVNGFNEKGIFIELNNGMASAGMDIHWEMRPGTTELFDLMFKAGTMDDIDRFFSRTRSFASFIIGVADKNEARSYEWCHEGVKRGDGATANGLMVSTNHYCNAEWDFGIPEDKESWNSITRRCNILDNAEKNKGGIGVGQMQGIMGKTIEEGGPLHKLTRYQLVVIPEEMTVHIRIPGFCDWTEIKMGRFLSP